MGSSRGSAGVRPALLEAVLLITAVSTGALAIVAGDRTHCTALVEFGLLSAIVATSAGVLFARHAVELCGFLADHRWFESWGVRLNTFGYLCLGGYALLNGVLDVFVPRRDPDFVSYPGLICTVIAVLLITLVVQTKYRTLEILSSTSLLASVSEDEFYLKIGAITLVALVGHVVAPAWWLDTALDAILVVLVACRVQNLRQRLSLSL